MSWFRRLLVESSIALLLLGSQGHAQTLSSPSEAVGLPQGPGVVPGNLPANVSGTNACATCVGATISITAFGPGTTSATTITSATPAVVTWTAHGFQTGQPVYFTGSVGTGMSINTPYYVNVTGANTFNVATTLANLYAGTYVATTGTGTPTGFAGAYLTSNSQLDVTGFQLPPGAWRVEGNIYFTPGGTTTISAITVYINSTANTVPAVPGYNTDQSTLTTGTPQAMNVPLFRSISSSTVNVSLQAISTFTTSTMVASGNLTATRYQ